MGTPFKPGGFAPATPRRPRLGGWLQFGGWMCVGAAWATGLLTLLSIGLFVLPIAMLGAALLLARGATHGVPGALSGAGVPLLFVAYSNRNGPGTVCAATGGGGMTCGDEWNPWPWLAIGCTAVLAGVLVFLALRARARRC